MIKAISEYRLLRAPRSLPFYAFLTINAVFVLWICYFYQKIKLLLHRHKAFLLFPFFREVRTRKLSLHLSAAFIFEIEAAAPLLPFFFTEPFATNRCFHQKGT